MAMALAATVEEEERYNGYKQNANNCKQQIAFHHSKPEEEECSNESDDAAYSDNLE